MLDSTIKLEHHMGDREREREGKGKIGRVKEREGVRVIVWR